jgi:DNA-directed RNA polymerase subunit RPC12/RpoP
MKRKIIPSTYDWRICQRPANPDHSVDYVCGNCGTVLLHAEDGLMHNLLILCTDCGARNSTDT